MNKIREDMNIVIVGHVDHGKSTIIGRLLADTDSLPKGKLEQVKEKCRRNSRPFEYSFLLDALKDEQAQGITIDAARCFFKSEKREYIIIDAPGHIEFLKNMVTGASRAEAALLVIDAHEGIRENSKRHGYLLSMLGIKQVAVLINKMDLVDYSEEVYNKIVKDYSEFLKQINIKPKAFIPVSGFEGDNIVSNSSNTSWYEKESILEILDSFQNNETQENQAFRMPVQDIYKFTRDGDNRRIVAGGILSGTLREGDEVVFYPSGKTSKVKSIEGFNVEKKSEIGSGHSTGFTLTEQIYISRGELVVKAGEVKPKVATRFRTNLFWLAKDSFIKDKKYLLKLGTSKVNVEVEEVTRVLDASTLSTVSKGQVDRHDVAEVILKTDKPVAFDENTNLADTSRFVIVDNYNIAGGGIIQEAIKDNESELREQVLFRNSHWEKSEVAPEERAEKYNQRSKLLLVTGETDSKRREVAKLLEKSLLDSGKKVYYLGLDNLEHGIDADIRECDLAGKRDEKIRRFAEISHLMLDAGLIVIASIANLDESEKKLIKTILGNEGKKENTGVVWVGDEIKTDLNCDVHINDFDYINIVVERLKTYLQEQGVIFKYQTK